MALGLARLYLLSALRTLGALYATLFRRASIHKKSFTCEWGFVLGSPRGEPEEERCLRAWNHPEAHRDGVVKELAVLQTALRGYDFQIKG